MKANEGYLYPLEKSFLFIPKPTTFIPHSEIGVVSFSRLGTTSGGSSRTFDIKFHMKNGSDIQFSSINREEYANLEEFLRSKRIKVKSVNNEETIVSYAELDEDEDEDEEEYSGRKKRRTEKEMDVDDEEESRKWWWWHVDMFIFINLGFYLADEDFAPDESGSEVAEEFDSEAASENESE